MIKVEKKYEFARHAGPVYRLCKGRSEQTFLSASGDRFIAEWHPETGEPSPFSVKLEDPCFAVNCLIEQHLLLVGTQGGNLHVIDLAAKQEIHNFKVHSKGIFAIEHIKGEHLIAVAGGDGFLSVWDIRTWKLVRHFAVSDEKLRSLTVIKDRLLVTTSGGELIVFDTPWLNELHRILAHEGGCYCVAEHPTKPLWVSGGKDGHLRFWHRDDIRPVRAIPAHNFGIYRIAFNTNGTIAASASRDKTVKFWNADSFDPVGRIERPAQPGHTHSVNDVMWLDERRIVTAGDDRRIILWEIDLES